MKNKNKYYYLIIIMSAIIVMTAIFILKKMAPFGTNSLLTIDFFHQYGPMLGELYNRIYHNHSLIYSFSMNLPFYRNYFNYLSSPVNIIMLLFKHKDLIMSYSFIISLKAVLSAVTIGYYFKEKFGIDYKFIPLCIMYAFSAYYVAYYWNIMWLDGMYMLPLVTLGIERLIDKKKPMLYILSLALMIYSNYFIGYMICIFSVIYFIMYLIIKTSQFDYKDILRKILLFVVSSLISGGLCAFFLIPLFYALKSISATGDIWPNSQYYAFTIKDLIFNHFSGVTSTVLKSGDASTPPNISCGILSVALFMVFMINNKIDPKIKLGYFGVLLILCFSFVVAPADYIWHGMHVPNDLPFRYSFIYSFILIITSAYAIKNIKSIRHECISIIYLLCLLALSLVKILEIENINTVMLTMNYIIITICYACYFVYNKYKKAGKYVFGILLLMVVCEAVLTINNNWQIDQDSTVFYDDTEEIVNSIKQTDSDKFFRMEKSNMLSLNDDNWYGYYGMGSFTSMEYQYISEFHNSLGAPGNEINSYFYKENTPIYNLMFDIKYIIGSVDNDEYYDTYNVYDVYKSKYTLGLMYGINPKIKEWVMSSDIFSNQNTFINYATGIDGVLTKLNNIEKDVVYNNNGKKIVRYRVLNNIDTLYIYLMHANSDFIYVDGELYYINSEYDYLYDCNELNVIDSIDYNERYIINKNIEEEYMDIYVGYDSLFDTDDLLLYILNNDKLVLAYDYLSNNKASIVSFKEDKIEGSVNLQKDMVMYTSISYDDGWNVYIDNKKVDTYKLGDALLAFDIPKGNHNIRLVYRIPHMKMGFGISLLSILSLLFLRKFNKYIFCDRRWKDG